MPVDAIGSQLNTATSNATQAVLNQEEFLRLFLTELSFQDPLEPINNREFLAQMAQFASLEQSRQNAESVGNLVFMNSTAQSVDLLGKTVAIVANGGAGEVVGVVSAVSFTPQGPSLTVKQNDGIGTVITDVRLSQVVRVTQQ